MKKEKTFIKIPYMRGVEGETEIEFIDAIFTTTDSIVKRYPDPDFGAWLIEELFEERKVTANPKGFFKQKDVCPWCGAELNSDDRQPVKTEYQLAYQDFPPFTVRITIPSVECHKCQETCGIDRGKTGDNLPEAIIHAFDSENIEP